MLDKGDEMVLYINMKFWKTSAWKLRPITGQLQPAEVTAIKCALILRDHRQILLLKLRELNLRDNRSLFINSLKFA